MKNFSRATSSHLMSPVLLAVIIGSLCFSVGEGLRLTPFPVSAQDVETDGVVVKASDKLSLSKYGPLDVPAQTQKRSKRLALDLAGPDSTAAPRLVASFRYLSEYEVVGAPSLLFVPRPEGRAPPLFS
jgi:hypothetical protein